VEHLTFLLAKLLVGIILYRVELDGVLVDEEVVVSKLHARRIRVPLGAIALIALAATETCMLNDMLSSLILPFCHA
jgi:hypothetical protein